MLILRSGFVSSLLVGLLAGCDINPSDPQTQTLGKLLDVGYVYHGSDGNRLVNGSADVANTTPLVVELAGRAEWLSTVHQGDESYWAVVLGSGDVQAFRVSQQQTTEVDISPKQVAPGTQPTLALREDGSLVLANVFTNASPYTSTLVLDKATGSRVHISESGELVLLHDELEQRLPVNALTYARILVDENKRLAVLSGPSLRYDHQVLGSAHQNATSITLVQTTPEFKVVSTIDIAAPDVIEGNPLIWVDVNGDGKREFVTTLSNVNEGARVVVYKEDGSVLSESAPIGIGYRWRHQLAVADFSNNAQQQLASVYIPHLGPVLEFIDMATGTRNATTSTISHSSHLKISLNLDKSLVGDFDNDGIVEVMLLERSSKMELAAYEFSGGSVAIDWTLALSDELTSNLAATQLADGKIVLGAGQNRQLRIWH